MADLPNRLKYEAELSKEIAAILARNRAELENPALDAPQSERSLREKLLGLLALIFTLGAGTAAGELGIALVADGASQAWANSYGTWLARTVLTSVRKRISKAQASDLTGEAGAVTKVLDQITTPKAWTNLAATEITRANTAGGEFTASVYNIGRMRLERGLPIIGQPITPDEIKPGEFVPADAPQPPSDEPPVIPEPALALWHTSRDDRVCPVCKPLHGRPKEEWQTTFPLGPPAHVACRCFVDYQLEATEAIEHCGANAKGGGGFQPGNTCGQDGDDKPKRKQTDTAEFKAWFGDSKVVDENGQPLVVYHGTNTDFKEFDFAKNKTARNSQFQGNGFFFTTNPDVAEQYANASANQLIDKASAIAAVEKASSKLESDLFKNIIEFGKEEGFTKTELIHGALQNWPSDVKYYDVMDVAGWVDGSAHRSWSNDNSTLDVLMGGGGIARPWYIDEKATKLGIDPPAPSVIPVYLRAEKVLKTSSQKAARAAQSKGYDAVLYSGPGRVGDAPEWIVFDPNQIKSATGNRGTFSRKSNRIDEQTR